MFHFLVLKDRHLKKTITNKLLNAKQATTPNNVNELPLFGLKFFISWCCPSVRYWASQLRTVFSLA